MIEPYIITLSKVLTGVQRGSCLPASLCLLPLVEGVLPRRVVPNVSLVCLSQFDVLLVLEEKADADGVETVLNVGVIRNLVDQVSNLLFAEIFGLGLEGRSNFDANGYWTSEAGD